MRKIFILGALGALLGGCAQDIWDKPGGTQEGFNVDLGGCQMFALGMPQVQPVYVPPTYTSNTTYSGSYTGGTVSGYSNTTVTPNNSGQGMANLGAAIGTAANQQAAMRACMASKGYTLRRQ